MLDSIVWAFTVCQGSCVSDLNILWLQSNQGENKGIVGQTKYTQRENLTYRREGNQESSMIPRVDKL